MPEPEKLFLMEFDIIQTHVTEVFASSLEEAKAIIQYKPRHAQFTGRQLTQSVGRVVQHDPTEYDGDALEECDHDLHKYFVGLPED